MQGLDEEKNKPMVEREGCCFAACGNGHHGKQGGQKVKPDWFWHPFNLAFDGSLERKYIDASRTHVVGLDCSVYVLTCVPIPMLLVLMWSTQAIPLAKIAMSIILIFLSPTLAYLSCYQMKWYWERRDAIVSLVHIAAGVGMMQWSKAPVEFIGAEGREPQAMDLATHILTRSPIAASLFCAVCMRLRFRKHLVVEMVMLVLGCAWSIVFCSSCSGLTLDQQSIGLPDALAKLIDGVHPVTLFLNLPESRRSCLGVCLFLTMVVGFLAPLAFVYYTEISSREKFLEARVDKCEKISLARFRKKGVECLFWFILTVVQVAWLVFREFG